MSCKPCGPNITSGPKPYYEEVDCHVKQSHETVVSHTEHAAGVLLGASWNVPEEDVTLTLPILDVSVLSAGMYLYNPQYGYFLISHWNPTTKHIGISNSGILGTAAPGTFVPQYTPFYITPKPCCEDDTSSIFPFVSEDFIAPLVGQTITVEVTSTFGLTVGSLIRIGSAVYRLDGINSTRQIVVFNQGAGFSPGSTVSASDSLGELQYLILTEVATVCSAEAEATAGRLVICDEGDQKILAGALPWRVPVLTSGPGSVVEFQLVGTESIGNAAINTAKIQNGAVDNLQIKDGAISNSKLQYVSINTPNFMSGVVTSGVLADGSVTTAKIVDDAVTVAKIADGAVTTAQIALGAVNVDRLGNGVVTNAKLSDDSITTSKLVDGSVTAAKLAALSISNASLANLVNSTSFTPATLGNFTTTGSSGLYWTFGPFILAYFRLELDFFGTEVNYCQLELPVSGKTTDGSNVNWIGTILFEGQTTTSGLQGSNVFPVINTGGPSDVLRIAFRPGITAVNTNDLDIDCFAIYPFR